MGRPRVLLITLLAALGCGDDAVTRPPPLPPVPPPPTPPPTVFGACPSDRVPWVRASRGAGGAVTLDEIMYHPAAGAPEWVELYNPLAIDFDVSNFRLGGAIAYQFPEGTRIAPGGYLVVAGGAMAGALGPFTGALPDAGGAVELWNNAGRLLDAVDYCADAPWPVGADGSGASLAKRRPDRASSPAEAWVASARIGGTPGSANFALPRAGASETWVARDARWRYRADGAAPPAGWAAPAFDDSGWSEGAAPLAGGAGPPPPMAVTVRFTADNFAAIYAGRADGSGLRLITRDAVGDWTSAETATFVAQPDEHLFIAAWEAPGSSGGPQMAIGQVERADGSVLSTDATTFEWALGPAGAAPGGALTDPAPPLAQVQAVIAGATWAAPGAVADSGSAPWGGALTGVFAAATRYVWADTFGDVSATNTANTYVLFRSRQTIVPPRGGTAIPTGVVTTYARTRFTVGDGTTPSATWLEHLIDDGAVVYLDGVEVLRARMPAGAVGPTTLATPAVAAAAWSTPEMVDGSHLAPGPHVLAIEVHQAQVADADVALAAALRATIDVAGPPATPPGLAINEVAAGGAGFWLELVNLGATPVALGGHAVRTASGASSVLAAGALAPGEVVRIDPGFAPAIGEPLFLLAPDGTALVDAVRVTARGRARRAPAQDWQVPSAATPGEANQFAPLPPLAISELMYHPPPLTAGDGTRAPSPLEWIELHNTGAAPLDVSGYQLADAVGYVIPAGTTIAADGYLVIAADRAAFTAAYPGASALGDYQGGLADGGDRVVVRDPAGNPVDAVAYLDDAPWPADADGGGASLELRDPRADHGAAASWAASDESGDSAWQTIRYQGVATASRVGPDGMWQELVLGLLDSGEILIDDVSVVVDPDTAPVELITGGDFESGGAAFRRLGNHRASAVVVDPDAPGNHVLRLVATGPTEHMHNHVEVTLAGGHRITDGRTYRISLRARWLRGTNLLNTRLYFARLARTTALPLPAAPGTPGRASRAGTANLGPTYRDLAHAPVVPAAGQPVTVTVVATDPDGVAGLTVRYAVAGGAPQAVAMVDGGGGRYAAAVPGQAAGAVVQFWIDGTDGAGATATAPAGGSASRALWKVDDGRAAQSGLHNLRVVMTPADAAWLFAAPNLMSNDYLGATVIVDEREAVYDVGVRLKGSERGRPTAPRVGFGLRFPADQPFRGILRSVLIDRSQGIGYGQREFLFFQAMNHAGAVPSQYDDLIQLLPPRDDVIGPAHLQLARFSGLALDGQFIHGSDGGLFEYELIYYPVTTDDGTPTGAKLPQPDQVVGTDVRSLGSDPEAYRLTFIPKNARWRDDYAAFIRFATAMGGSGPTFDAQIGDVIDVDQWLRAMAFATISGAIDNYASGAQHNADFYLRPDDGRALYFPHDLDFVVSNTGPLVASGDLAKLIAVPERRRAYYGHLLDILTTSYNPTYMQAWTTQFGALLPGQDFGAHLAAIAARHDWILTGASDAIMRTFPPLGFRVTTAAPLVVAAPTVTLDGEGWIDVATVTAGGAPLALTWPTATAWRATVAPACGTHDLALVAVDRHGATVGTATITITRTGTGCP